MPFTVGDLIDGHYRVEKRYAGGMGFVYIVRDEVVGKRFAIKQLPDFQAENKVLFERFRREASAWLLLDYHPNIVQAHSFHPRPEGPILILEFVDGPGLDRLLKAEKKLSPVQVVRYARQFCQAMNYAHLKPIPDRGIGVLHRDIKPGNILITRTNQVKVTDFGLAKFEENETKLTGEGQYVGTIAYSSPEQLRSADRVTKASDVYSLGAVMYQMLTGQPPFRASTAAELYRLITQTSPLPIQELCPELDRGLAGIVMRCLEKESSGRFADFAELDKAMAGLEFLLKDRRDWSCKACGYTSRSNVTQCPVCEAAVTGAKSSVPETAGWNCVCGFRVSLSEKSCPKCNRTRVPAGAAVLDDDAPLPVSADLVLLPTAEEAGEPAQPLKPSDTAWPGGLASPGDSNLVASPGDSNVAAAVSGAPQSATKRLWDPAVNLPTLVEVAARDKLLGWLLERSNYTVGRDAHMRIRLKDADVAGFQLFLVRLACGWLAMNRQLGTRVHFNGWKSDQRLLQPGDLLQLGSTWLAYSGPHCGTQSLPPIPGRWPERIEPPLQTVRSGGSAATTFQEPRPSLCVLELSDGREITTRGEPLQIGSSAICPVRLSDATAAPVQALVAWQLEGPTFVNIAGGSVTFPDGRPVSRHTVSPGDSIRIGSSLVHFRIDGDPTAPARLRAAEELRNPPRMALTIVAGPQKGQTAVLATGEPAILGRHSECELSIPTDPYMSRRHLQLTPRHGSIEVKDLGSRHGFAIGQTVHSDSASARLGEVIRVGQSFFLVHYEFR